MPSCSACLTERGPEDITGVGNYFLRVRSSRDERLNDFEGELQGIRLCYGRASRHSPYGREGFPRGARVIRLREGERGFTTWLRLDGGSILSEPLVYPPGGRSFSDE